MVTGVCAIQNPFERVTWWTGLSSAAQFLSPTEQPISNEPGAIQTYCCWSFGFVFGAAKATMANHARPNKCFVISPVARCYQIGQREQGTLIRIFRKLRNDLTCVAGKLLRSFASSLNAGMPFHHGEDIGKRNRIVTPVREDLLHDRTLRLTGGFEGIDQGQSDFA